MIKRHVRRSGFLAKPDLEITEEPYGETCPECGQELIQCFSEEPLTHTPLYGLYCACRLWAGKRIDQCLIEAWPGKGRQRQPKSESKLKQLEKRLAKVKNEKAMLARRLKHSGAHLD